MQYATYSDLSALYGKRRAFDLLVSFERMTQIRNEIISLDLDARFEKAFKALCNINFAV